GHVARVPAVGLSGNRVEDVADQAQRRYAQDRIHDCRGGIRDQQYVTFMDVLEAADAGPVESDAVAEEAGRQLPDRDRKMLPGADQVDELQVDDLQTLLVGQVDNRVDVRPGLFLGPNPLV